MTIFLSGNYVLLTKEQITELFFNNESEIYMMLRSWIEKGTVFESSPDISEEMDEATHYNNQLLKARKNMEKYDVQIKQKYPEGGQMNSDEFDLWKKLDELYEEIKKEMLGKGYPLPDWANEE